MLVISIFAKKRNVINNAESIAPSPAPFKRSLFGVTGNKSLIISEGNLTSFHMSTYKKVNCQILFVLYSGLSAIRLRFVDFIN